jgi:hypothetical protein
VNSTENLLQKKEKKGEKLIYLLLIFLLCGSNAVFGWLWWHEHGQIKIITVEKEAVIHKSDLVKEELVALQAQYESLRVSNASMQKKIDAKTEEITQLLNEFEKNKGNDYTLAKLKKETQTLREIMQHFVHEMDSLNTYSKHAITEKESIKKELKSEQEKNVQLNTEKEELKETVKIASMLKAMDIVATGIDERKGGRKESETKKASRTDKIKISFTFAENTIAKKGDRIVYLRIVAPNGEEITQVDDSLHVFSFGRSHGYWASKKSVNYANEETGVVMYAHAKEGELFPNGKYLIEVNCEGETLGSTTLELE